MNPSRVEPERAAAYRNANTPDTPAVAAEPVAVAVAARTLV